MQIIYDVSGQPEKKLQHKPPFVPALPERKISMVIINNETA